MKVELTRAEEALLIPLIISVINSIPKTSFQIISEVEIGWGIKITGPKLRKVINTIRSKEIEPILSKSTGYFISYNSGEIESYCESLEGRIESMKEAMMGLRGIKKKTKKKRK